MTRAMTLTTYAIGLLLLVGSADACGGYGADLELLPLAEGTEWTFRVSSNASAVTSRTVVAKASKAPKGATVWSPSAAEDRDVESREIEGELLIDAGDAGAVHVERAKDGALSIALNTFHGSEFFTERFTIPASPADGAEWAGEQVFASCGFGAAPATFHATRERVTVPAGTFRALKVEAKCSGQVFETLWLLEGVGIVKLDTGCETWELVRRGPQQCKAAAK